MVRVVGSRNGDSACETVVSGLSQDHLRKMKAGTGKQEPSCRASLDCQSPLKEGGKRFPHGLATSWRVSSRLSGHVDAGRGYGLYTHPPLLCLLLSLSVFHDVKKKGFTKAIFIVYCYLLFLVFLF